MLRALATREANDGDSAKLLTLARSTRRATRDGREVTCRDQDLGAPLGLGMVPRASKYQYELPFLERPAGRGNCVPSTR